MFLHACMCFLHVEVIFPLHPRKQGALFINCNEYKMIQVVELDPMILNLARDHFDFAEDPDLKVFLLHLSFFVS